MNKTPEKEIQSSVRLKNWLKSHPLINITSLEVLSGTPIKAIAITLCSERNIPPKHIDKIVEVLKHYGYETSNV